MDPTFTAKEILAAFKTWYRDAGGEYTEADAVEAAAYLVQTMEDLRGQPEPV